MHDLSLAKVTERYSVLDSDTYANTHNTSRTHNAGNTAHAACRGFARASISCTGRLARENPSLCSV